MEETKFYSLTAFENERLPCNIFGIILFARYICQTNLNIWTKLPTRPNKSVDLENTIVSDWLIAPLLRYFLLVVRFSHVLRHYLIFASFFIISALKSCKNVQKMCTKQILSSVWSVQHPNAGQNIQHQSMSPSAIFPIRFNTSINLIIKLACWIIQYYWKSTC